MRYVKAVLESADGLCKSKTLHIRRMYYYGVQIFRPNRGLETRRYVNTGRKDRGRTVFKEVIE